MRFACGLGNPGSLRLEFRALENADDDHVFADWTPDPAVHQGWAHAMSGGLVETLLDEAAAYVAYVRDQPAATARLSVRFLAPAVVSDHLRVDARLTRSTRRLLEVHPWVSNRATGATKAEADASLVLMTKEQRKEFGADAELPGD